MFEDRLAAGQALTAELSDYDHSPDAIVLALPRGGVVVGFAIHRALDLPLDVFITRKLRAPENPEFALGALTETGYRFVNPDVQGWAADPWAESYLARETEHQRLEIDQRKQLYRSGRDLSGIAGRTVLLVDDGVATGSTVIAAVRGLRVLGPAQIVVAAPVGSAQAVEMLKKEADRVVVPCVPPHFRAVGEHYRHFAQVDDDEVVAYLSAQKTKE